MNIVKCGFVRLKRGGVMTSEVMVVVKDEEKNLRTKYLIYDNFSVDEEDPIIKDCVDKTLKNFDGEPTDISVKITMEIK